MNSSTKPELTENQDLLRKTVAGLSITLALVVALITMVNIIA